MSLTPSPSERIMACPRFARLVAEKFGAMGMELRGIDGPNVLLQAPDGRTAAFPLAQFSAADRRYVAARLPGLVLDAMPPTW